MSKSSKKVVEVVIPEVTVENKVSRTIKMTLYQNDVKFTFKLTTGLELNSGTLAKVTAILGGKLLKVYESQTKIKTLGGKNRIFNVTKGAAWLLNIDVIEENDNYTLVGGVEFNIAHLGTENAIESLVELVDCNFVQSEVLLLE
jgi:hypothetical protein